MRNGEIEAESSDKHQVLIPQDLYDLVRKLIEGKGFSTVDDYVTFVLRVNMGKKSSSNKQVDDENVMKQLKALGYI
jgi:hypothetical protein